MASVRNVNSLQFRPVQRLAAAVRAARFLAALPYESGPKARLTAPPPNTAKRAMLRRVGS